MGATHTDTSFPAIDLVVNERGALEAGAGDDVVRLCKNVPDFVVFQVPDVERDHREIGSGGVERDVRILVELPDDKSGKIPAFMGYCILSLAFDVADAGKERGNAGIVRGAGLELLRHVLRVSKYAGIRTGTSLADRGNRLRVMEVEPPDTGEPKERLVPGEDERMFSTIQF